MNPTRDYLDDLAARLRSGREQAGLSGRELATRNGWQPSKVSRTETGKQMPSAADVMAWARACDLPDAELHDLLGLRDKAEAGRADWRERMRRGQAAVQRDYTKLVAESARIRHFETVGVPGLLQTPDYCRRTLAEVRDLHGSAVDDLDEAVAERLARQRYLYDTSKRFEFLLAEPVLRWLFCPPSVMRSQLDRLHTVIGVPHVRFGILPFGVELRTIPQNSFVLYDDIATVEGFVGDGVHLDQEAEFLGRVLGRLWDDAVEGDDARRLIMEAAGGLRP